MNDTCIMYLHTALFPDRFDESSGWIVVAMTQSFYNVICGNLKQSHLWIVIELKLPFKRDMFAKYMYCTFVKGIISEITKGITMKSDFNQRVVLHKDILFFTFYEIKLCVFHLVYNGQS